MADLVTQDDLQAVRRLAIPGIPEAGDHARGHVQAPRLQHPGDQGHAHQGIARGAPRHGPEAIMGREITIVMAQGPQAVTHEVKMQGLLGRHAHPIVVIGTGQAAKTVNGIPGQVDGVEFDMGHGVDQGRATLAAAMGALG